MLKAFKMLSIIASCKELAYDTYCHSFCSKQGFGGHYVIPGKAFAKSFTESLFKENC
jgi:hypothetical protein